MDKDYALALQLNEELHENGDFGVITNFKINTPLSLVDSSWELIDPLPDIRELFVQFNEAYFYGKLAGVEVKWSKRMTLCAGICCYEGRGGLCSIKLSEPLLKLRPRSDLINTLLHEMIHALLFVTENNKDHDGHGPEFHKHMYRINKETGTEISVYHSFHDEVDNYRQHWWRCDGPCVRRPPFYGIVRRAMNRAPCARDPWFNEHKQKCGGTFLKIKEPEKPTKAKKSQVIHVDKKSKTAKNIHTSTKEITDWFSKTDKMKNHNKYNEIQNGDNSCYNANLHKLESKYGERLKTDLLWNSKTPIIKDNVLGFSEIANSDSRVGSVLSGSIPSNIHGFKESENKKKLGISNRTFSGKGFKVQSSSSVTSRESFLKRIENDINSNTCSRSAKRRKENVDDINLTKNLNKCNCYNSVGKNGQASKLAILNVSNHQKIATTSSSSKYQELKENIKGGKASIDLASTLTSIETDSPGCSNHPIVLDDSLITTHIPGFQLIECPACPAKIPEHQLNQHLDMCLS